MLLLSSSCKKDWNCDCTVTGVTTTVVISHQKKKDAQEVCDTLSSSAAIANGSCELE